MFIASYRQMIISLKYKACMDFSHDILTRNQVTGKLTDERQLKKTGDCFNYEIISKADLT